MSTESSEDIELEYIGSMVDLGSENSNGEEAEFIEIESETPEDNSETVPVSDSKYITENGFVKVNIKKEFIEIKSEIPECTSEAVSASDSQFSIENGYVEVNIKEEIVPFDDQSTYSDFDIISNSEEVVEDDGKKDSGYFVCKICRKEFTHRYHLKQHSLTHVNERRYKCKHCNKSFSYRSYLDRHASVHSGTRPFKCDICKKSFTRKYTLKTHLMLHYKTMDTVENNGTDTETSQSGSKTFKVTESQVGKFDIVYVECEDEHF